MTPEESKDLHEQATQLCYQALIYDHLGREPLCRDDELAEQMAKKVMLFVRGLLDEEWGRIETAKEAVRDE